MKVLEATKTVENKENSLQEKAEEAWKDSSKSLKKTAEVWKEDGKGLQKTAEVWKDSWKGLIGKAGRVWQKRQKNSDSSRRRGI